jgi:hypothetical protein
MEIYLKIKHLISLTKQFLLLLFNILIAICIGMQTCILLQMPQGLVIYQTHVPNVPKVHNQKSGAVSVFGKTYFRHAEFDFYVEYA